MKQRAKEVNEIGDRLFSQRLPIVSLWQEMALSVQARARMERSAISRGVTVHDLHREDPT